MLLKPTTKPQQSCRCVTDGCWLSLSPDRCASSLCVPTLGVEVGVRHVVLRNRQCALTPSLHLVTLSARGGWRKVFCIVVMKNKLYRIEGTNFSFWLMHVYKKTGFYSRGNFFLQLKPHIRPHDASQCNEGSQGSFSKERVTNSSRSSCKRNTGRQWQRSALRGSNHSTWAEVSFACKFKWKDNLEEWRVSPLQNFLQCLWCSWCG
nr:uncharacterized protein LOC110360145 isoform X2 [Columba livia]